MALNILDSGKLEKFLSGIFKGIENIEALKSRFRDYKRQLAEKIFEQKQSELDPDTKQKHLLWLKNKNLFTSAIEEGTLELKKIDAEAVANFIKGKAEISFQVFPEWEIFCCLAATIPFDNADKEGKKIKARNDQLKKFEAVTNKIVTAEHVNKLFVPAVARKLTEKKN